MDLLSTVRKTGSRGGVNFSWDDVANSSHRENYLGHSLKAPVGRWQKGRDLTWYAKADPTTAKEGETEEERQARERREELRKIKEAEEDALARALGLPAAPRNVTGANAVEVDGSRIPTKVAGDNNVKDDKPIEARENRRRHEGRGREGRDSRDTDRRHRRRHRDQSRSRERRRDRSPRRRHDSRERRLRDEDARRRSRSPDEKKERRHRRRSHSRSPEPRERRRSRSRDNYRRRSPGRRRSPEPRRPSRRHEDSP